MDEATVKVVEPCSGGKPNAQKLYIPYYIWLQAGAIKDVQKMTDRCRKNWSTTKGDGRITWIEKLLQTVIDDNRYFCVWRVLIPYLINIRGLSRLDARDIILSWLDRCSSIRKLSFGLKKVDWSLSHPGTKPPIARLKLEGENPPLFKILKDKGVIY
jgi:hypothetical protein